MATPRIYLTGSVAIEHGEQLIRERDFPGRQGRIAFAFLALHRHRTIHRDEMLTAIWPDHQGDGGLDPILSKLRGVLRTAGFTPGEAGIEATGGTIALRLPDTSWVDVEAAANALDEAEGALRRQDLGAVWGHANTAVVITRRPLLPNAEAPWIESQRSVLRAMLLRALQCLVSVSAASEPRLAIQHASEMVTLEPFRETAYQLLMRMHAAAGDRAEALRVFARCRELLRDELGVSPSPQTEAVYLEILRAEAGP